MRPARLAGAGHALNDVLLSAPSIIIGLFIYAVYVAQVGYYFRAGPARWRCHPG